MGDLLERMKQKEQPKKTSKEIIEEQMKVMTIPIDVKAFNERAMNKPILDPFAKAKQTKPTIEEKKELKDRITLANSDGIDAIHVFEGKEIFIRYLPHNTCMVCNKNERFVCGESAGCPVCDKLMTEQEYQEFEKKIQSEKPKMLNVFAESKKKEEKIEQKDVFVEKKTILPQQTSTFDFKTHPIIALLWGYDGTSKSEQIIKFEPRKDTLIFDLEDKLRPQASKLKFPQENIINARKYNEKYNINGPDTLDAIRKIIDEVKECKRTDSGRFKNIKSVAIDGISDIRPYAELEWLEEHPERKRPMNAGDWGEINDKVRDICFSMINMGIVTNTNIFFTAQIGYDYNEKKEIPECKPWIWHNIQHKFKFRRDDDNHRFYAYCEKSYYDPFFDIDLTDFSSERNEKPSLLNMLQDPELLEKHKQKSVESLKEISKKKLDNVFGTLNK